MSDRAEGCWCTAAAVAGTVILCAVTAAPAWSRTRHALRGDSHAGQRKNSLHTTREKYHQTMNKIVTNIFLHIYVLLWT